MKLKALAAVALAAPLMVACGSTEKANEPFRLNGAGASFPAMLYSNWFTSFSKDTGNKVNYQAVGSGAGVRQFKAKTVDFGASDGAVKDSKQPAEGMVHIPMTGGAIVPAYNNPGCDLKMTQTELADVFLGKIDQWSHFGCEGGVIKTVHRSDGSGTTKGFTNSLSAFSPEWKKTVGTGKSVQWPVGVGGKGNSGVAAGIKLTPGSIGYVNYGYVQNDPALEQPALQNKAGNFVKASAETASAGLGEIVLDDQLRGADANPAGANAYPIVSLTWILAYPEYEKNEAVKEVLRYALTPTQQGKADSLGYVPLPESLRQKALAAVESLK
ncbi:phosphate transporter subunit [Synechococcus phage Syn19]|nr:phosphate transporter subunit [Synechococcus phage Syn19]ADO99398.1 phosphate transporter subunit [Synechococcus phage Syn19]7XG7_A Chain A, Phosphate transporter subunit [Synechococcus phage Syn19]7XG7_B Chain B, Phosphate transporter subunit [Synechococcus phage Syn19]